MANESQTASSSARWRLIVALGFALALALPVVRLVTCALEPVLGHVGARDLSFLAAGATGPLAGLVICWLGKKTVRPR